MNHWADLTIVLLAMANLVLLGSSRLGLCIRVVAVQGVALGAFTVLSHADSLTIHVLLLALMSTTLKGFVFPMLLNRTLLRTEARRELEPLVGYTASILLGLVMLGTALWLGVRLPLDALHASPLVAPVALWTMFTGLFLVVARRKALTQVLGYLVLENGIFAFGAALVREMPFLVELGGLLDVFMAVFVMGLAILDINREFEHTDTERLSALRD